MHKLIIDHIRNPCDGEGYNEEHKDKWVEYCKVYQSMKKQLEDNLASATKKRFEELVAKHKGPGI